jgi:hypothetical protein
MRRLLVPLTSLLQNAGADNGGLRSPRACRITHGPCDSYFENIVGKSIASIRRCLASVFSIPDDSEAFIDGSVVDGQFRLRAGDWLEFSKRWGRKEAAKFLGTNFGQREPNDFYPTPAHATLALLSRERFGRAIWEPACGDGAISKVLQAAGYEVLSSDLIDRGCGAVLDFLASSRKVESIVTNPPFRLAEAFVRKAVASSSYKVAMLLRLTFLEGQSRYQLFQETPLKTMYVFSKRLSLYRSGEENQGGGTTAFAWFVWEHGYAKEPTIRWIAPGDAIRG